MKLPYQQSYLLQGALGAMLVNLLLFGLLPGLIHMETRGGDLESLNAVTFTRIKPALMAPDPSPKKEEKKEEKKPEKIHKIVHHEKMTVPRKQLKMKMPQVDLNIDPRLSDGIPMIAPAKEPPVAAPVAGTADGPDFDAVMDQGAVDVVPVPKFKAAPRYPYRAKRMGREGTVKIGFLVDKDGNVSDIKILEANPSGFFEEAVLDAVSSWKYAPGELMGRKVATRVTTSVVFKLER